KLGRNWVTTNEWMEEYLKSANEWKTFLQTNGVPGARKKNEKTVFIKKIFVATECERGSAEVSGSECATKENRERVQEADENVSAPTLVPMPTLAIEMSPHKEELVEKYFVSSRDLALKNNEDAVLGNSNKFENDESSEVLYKKIAIAPSDDKVKKEDHFSSERSPDVAQIAEPVISKFSRPRSASRDYAILGYAFAVLFGFFFTSEVFSDFVKTKWIFSGVEDATFVAREISLDARGAIITLSDNFFEIFSRDIDFSYIAERATRIKNVQGVSLRPFDFFGGTEEQEERYAWLTPFGNGVFESASSFFSGTQLVLIGFVDYITELLSPSDRVFVFKTKLPAEVEKDKISVPSDFDAMATEEKNEEKVIIVQSPKSAPSIQSVERVVRETVIPADLTAFQNEFQRNLDNLDRRTASSLKQLTEQMLSVAVKANQSYVRTGDAIQMISVAQDIDRLSNVTVSGTLRTENLVISGECSGCGSGGVGSGIAGSLSFYASSGTNVSGTANGLLSWDDTNARLGIGTTSPYAKLSVAGPIVGEYITATSTTATSTFAHGVQASIFHATSTTASSTFANGINLKNGCFSINGVCAGTGNGTINAGTINTLPYYSSGTTLDSAVFLSITTNNSGLFGIGTTSPWSRLSVTGTAGTTSPIFTIASSTNQTYFTIGYDGNVGIGTTSPYAKLSVVGEVVGAYFTGTTTATSTLTGGLLTNDIRVSSGGLTIAGGSLVSTVSATNTFAGGIIASHLNSTAGISLNGSLLNISSASSTFTGGISTGGLSSSNGLTISGGALRIGG
ncbi:MAG: hypothetical protein AAB362_00920, partial [Patescibacteria group bacterium]